MGLDITAWSHIKRMDEQDLDNYACIRIWKHSSFPLHCELEDGCYEVTELTEAHNFRAGTYSGYNMFRDILTFCTSGVPSSSFWENEDLYQGNPFFELINFSDCDGAIGPEYSSRLYDDFVQNRKRFIANLRQEIDYSKVTTDPLALEPEFFLDLNLSEDSIDYYIEQYDNWTRSFELAKDCGIVEFH
jgi:hypothetical protein